jgi:predicted XRE-type DNA-binding protein
MTDKSKTYDDPVTRSGDNLFEALGFSAERADQLTQESDREILQLITMKKQVMSEIADWMKEGDIKQIAAAKILQVSRPRVSDVVNQKTEKFTLDALISMVGCIGKKVHLVIE